MHPLRKVLTVATAAVVAVAGSIAVTSQASAAAGCRVDYTVTNQWQSGFGAERAGDQPGRPDHRVGPALLLRRRPDRQPAVERLRHPVRGGGVGAQRRVERERRHQRHRVVRLQRHVGREQPRADRVHAQRRRVHREPGHPDQHADDVAVGHARPRHRGRRARRHRTPSPTTGPITGNAAQLVADLGKGWNLGNQLEANINGVPSETAWGNPVVTGALIDRVKASGFTTIRIPVSYLGKIGSAPSYTVDAAWLSRIQEVVNLPTTAGCTCIDQHARRRLQERQRLLAHLRRVRAGHDQGQVPEGLAAGGVDVQGLRRAPDPRVDERELRRAVRRTRPSRATPTSTRTTRSSSTPCARPAATTPPGGCSCRAGTPTSTTPPAATASSCRPTSTGRRPSPATRSAS